MTQLVKVLFIGDIIGSPGRSAVKRVLPKVVEGYDIDFVIANGENAAGGFGITPPIADELLERDIDVLTSGNHIWDKKEVVEYLDHTPRLLRPENYPDGVPGRGHGLFETEFGATIGVVNLCGRVFMGNLDCPFRTGERVVNALRGKSPLLIVDIHAETTSEKGALAWFLDGKVSAVIGSHTHIQTADERVLPQGTAFITDAGMTGSVDSVIGMEKEIALERFLTGMPKKFEVARGNVEFQGVVITIERENGRAVAIERVKKPV
ncbi:MAG: TIGR00282 family metallophosphoesterase [Thermodesulfobacteriota bacterium]